MLVEHPEDWKEISEQIEEEERRKKRKRKLIIIPSVLAGAVLTILFFTLWLPSIISSANSPKEPKFGLVMETTAGERVQSGDQYLWAWAGVVENSGNYGGYCRVTLKTFEDASNNGTFVYDTGFIISGGRASYSFLIQSIVVSNVTSYSLDIATRA